MFHSSNDGAMKAKVIGNSNSSIDIVFIKIYSYLHYNGRIMFAFILIGVVVLYLISYVFIYYLGLLESKFKWMRCVIANVYDLIIFVSIK